MSAERPEYPTQRSYQATPTGASDPGGRPGQNPGDRQQLSGEANRFPGDPQPGSPAETAGLVRGLQAWMADLDRRLSIRTKLLLGLVALAIGAAGAAIYLSVEANRTTASQEEFAELRQEVEQLQQQLGVMPTESELDDATGAIEGAADEAAAAADEAAGAADEAGAAAGAADEAAGAADEAERGATEEKDASAIIEEAMRERFNDMDEGPPMPEIGSD